MLREVVSESPALLTSLTSEEDPPPYGAQCRQDALWKGGNDALPPLWQEFKVLNDRTRYVDSKLYMGSWNRPLPGVRLGGRGDLIPGCEWHISPLGRSYFVNHTTRTTSWERHPPEPLTSNLMPERVIEGHSGCIWSIACLSTCCHIMSTSTDGSIRQWTRDGEPVGKPWISDGEAVGSIAVSPDNTKVVSGSADGRIRLWNVGEGNVIGDPWDGHNAIVRCLDWSPNGLEILSGSEDGTLRRWNPDTGKQIISTTETGHSWVFAVKYSPQGDKYASCGIDGIIRVWSNDGEPLNESKGHGDAVKTFCWAMDGAHIFSAGGSALSDCIIRQWQPIDGKERIVLRGHANTIASICLSPDARYLVGALIDRSIRIWDLRTNRPVGSPLLHDNDLCDLAISPDGKYIVAAGVDAKIYLWNLDIALGSDRFGNMHGRNVESEAILKRHPAPSTDQTNSRVTRYGDDFWGNDTSHARPRSAPPVGPSSLLRRRNLFDFLRFSTRHANTPQPIAPQPQPRHRKFRFSPIRPSIHTVNVAPARDEDRYFVEPPSQAEVTAAMQYASGDSSVGQSPGAAGAQGSQVYMQGRPTQTARCKGSDSGAGEPSYDIGCCGFYLVRRPSLHE